MLADHEITPLKSNPNLLSSPAFLYLQFSRKAEQVACCASEVQVGVPVHSGAPVFVDFHV